MNHQQRFLAIHDFLKPYQRIWENEIMLLYPDPLKDYPLDWVEELASFGDKETQIELEKKNVTPYLKNPSLLAFYQRIEELSALPGIPDLPPMPENSFTWLYMIPKKQYEIRRLAPVVNHYYQEKQLERIIDIGGGIGLLAQTLNNNYGLPVTTLDLDPALQKTGIERHQKNARNPLNKVQYHLVKVDLDNAEFHSLLRPRTMTLGLHTCGDLANAQLKASAARKLPLMINFGCCYHRLDKVEQGMNISRFAQSVPDVLNFNQFTLTLASRAHRKMDEKDWDFKLKVKLYRYTFHFLLHDHYQQEQLVTLGNSHQRLYEQKFSSYALEQLRRLGLASRHTADELDSYYEAQGRQELIWKMITASHIRSAFGRLLELYILLDRAMYLEEQGYQVELMEFFDESISPRNIGLVASF